MRTKHLPTCKDTKSPNSHQTFRYIYFSPLSATNSITPPQRPPLPSKVNETWAGSQAFQYGKVCKRRSLL